MNRQHRTPIATSGANESEASDVGLPQLVARVYEAAPALERSRLLEHLIQPLGVLSLAVVANGIFSKLRFLGGWPDVHIRPEDAARVRAEDIVALVEFVQQASGDVVDGLAQLLSDSPALSATAAATVVISVILRRTRTRYGSPGASSP